MTLLMRDQENREIGRQEGRQEGEELMAALIQRLSKDNRLPDIGRVVDDKEYRQKLYVEYHIL